MEKIINFFITKIKKPGKTLIFVINIDCTGQQNMTYMLMEWDVLFPE